MIEQVQMMGVYGSLKVTGTFSFTRTGELGIPDIDIPIGPGRNEFGKTILIPDFEPVYFEIRKQRALGRIK